MRKPELAAVIADKADLTKEKANQVLNAILDSITGALDKDTVTLVGFGTFEKRHRGARTGKNRKPVSRSRSKPVTPWPSSQARTSRTASIHRPRQARPPRKSKLALTNR